MEEYETLLIRYLFYATLSIYKLRRCTVLGDVNVQRLLWYLKIDLLHSVVP
jgi:hypothetical protein